MIERAQIWPNHTCCDRLLRSRYFLFLFSCWVLLLYNVERWRTVTWPLPGKGSGDSSVPGSGIFCHCFATALSVTVIELPCSVFATAVSSAFGSFFLSRWMVSEEPNCGLLCPCSYFRGLPPEAVVRRSPDGEGPGDDRLGELWVSRQLSPLSFFQTTFGSNSKGVAILSTRPPIIEE